MCRKEKEQDKNRQIQYAFTVFPGIGRRTKRRLLEYFSEEEMLHFQDKEWKQVLSEKEWQGFCKYKVPYNIEETGKEWERMRQKQIDFLYYRQEEYPEKLRQMDDYPLGIFKRGRVPGTGSGQKLQASGSRKEERCIAIVGSRIPTAYGKEMAFYFARELAKAGIGIVSGLAFGIDIAAHKGALEAGGLTYGILGCGPDLVYPKEHFSVYEQVIRQGGIISEYKPGTEPLAFRFPERNRIISGLSDGVLVIEAKDRSGSLITADAALEQGKDVFALPGRATDPLSEGCNWLIREGARAVTKPCHILEELFHLCENKEKNLVSQDNLLEKKEKIVYDCLSLEPKSVEEIINETNITVSEVISILFRLELNGYIHQIVKNMYIRRL